jgi:hypothetical protein
MFEYEDFKLKGSQRVMFYMGVKPDKERSRTEGRPIFVDTPFIKIFTAGDQLTIIDKPVWDDANNPNSHTARYPDEWKRFKEGVEGAAQSGGTPLKLMPGISQAQVRELEHFHCYTVEQLADISDAHGSKFMGIQGLKNEARSYLLRAKGHATERAIAQQLEARDQEIALLKAQMQELLAASRKKDEPAEEAPAKPAKAKRSSKATEKAAE